MARTICSEIGRIFELRVVLIEDAGAGLVVTASTTPDTRLEAMELAAARWVQDTGKPAGRGSGTLAASDWLFLPLVAGERTLAVLGVAREDGSDPVRSDQLLLLASLNDQAALVLERLRLESENRDLDAVRERDRLRAALLSSVSHDLRTPLTSVLSAAQQLRQGCTPALIDMIESEALRLNRFVSNLLDMTRVEAGALKLKIEPTDLTDAVAAAVHDARAALDGHAINLDVSPNLPLVLIDPRLFHHCLLNLLDNAGRYADHGTPITIRGERRHDGLALRVLDEGPGLPAGTESKVFETFHQLDGSDRTTTGTGLGLAIVKGFAEGMGLTVRAANRHDRRGADFSLTFPERLLVRERLAEPDE